MEGLPSQKRGVASGVPGGVEKTSMWLVAAMTVETWWLWWRKEGWRRRRKKTGERLIFFPTLTSLNAWNPPYLQDVEEGQLVFTSAKY